MAFFGIKCFDFGVFMKLQFKWNHIRRVSNKFNDLTENSHSFYYFLHIEYIDYHSIPFDAGNCLSIDNLEFFFKKKSKTITLKERSDIKSVYTSRAPGANNNTTNRNLARMKLKQSVF